jgi:hypothetical protein
MEMIMWYRSSIAVVAALMAGGVAAAAAELPTYEVTGLAITAHQLAVLGPAHAEQRPPAVTLTMAGMPASPHQIAILTPRHRAIGEQTGGDGGQATTKHAQLSPDATTEQLR